MQAPYAVGVVVSKTLGSFSLFFMLRLDEGSGWRFCRIMKVRGWTMEVPACIAVRGDGFLGSVEGMCIGEEKRNDWRSTIVCEGSS